MPKVYKKMSLIGAGILAASAPISFIACSNANNQTKEQQQKELEIKLLSEKLINRVNNLKKISTDYTFENLFEQITKILNLNEKTKVELNNQENVGFRFLKENTQNLKVKIMGKVISIKLPKIVKGQKTEEEKNTSETIAIVERENFNVDMSLKINDLLEKIKSLVDEEHKNAIELSEGQNPEDSIRKINSIKIKIYGVEKEISLEKKLTLDLNQISSVKELINKIIDNFKLQMPQFISRFLKENKNKDIPQAITEESFNDFKNYFNQIQFENIELIFNGQKEIIDLNEAKKVKNLIDQEFAKGYAESKTKKQAQEILGRQSGQVIRGEVAFMPNIATIVSKTLGFSEAIKLWTFMSIPGDGFETYNNLLDEYHNFSWKIINTEIYKTWVVNKTYIFKPNKDKNEVSFAPNTYFDNLEKNKKPIKALLDIWVDTPSWEVAKNIKEFNNFEAQLIWTIINTHLW